MEEGKEPKRDHDAPTLSDSTKPSGRRHDHIGFHPAAELLRDFLNVMNATGDDAQKQYDAALAELRKHGEDVIVEVARAEGACEESNYPFRSALCHVATELRHPAALPFLRRILSTPIPPERSSDPHTFSTVAEETILRTIAVEGVGHLAAEGNQVALETLFDCLRQSSLSVRRAAVQAILATKEGKNVRARMAQLLPKEEQFLLELKREDVRKVAQVKDPQRHLGEAARQRDKEPSPRLPGEPEGDAPKVY